MNRASSGPRRPVPWWLSIAKPGERAVFMRPPGYNNAQWQRALGAYAHRAGRRIKVAMAAVVPHDTAGECFPACIVEVLP